MGHGLQKLKLTGTAKIVVIVVYDHTTQKDWVEIWRLPMYVTSYWSFLSGNLVHKKIPTGAYLNNLNIGPYINCSFCGLVEEMEVSSC